MAATDLSSALGNVLQVPGLQELMNNIITEQRQQAPLRAGVKQMAAGMMPSYAFGSGGRPDIAAIPHANYNTPPSSSGDLLQKLLPWLLLGGAGAKAAGAFGGGNGSGASGNLSPLASAIKSLFGGHGSFGTPHDTNPMEPAVNSDFSAIDFAPAGPLFSGPSDPSGGTGVGPGMSSFYGSGGGPTITDGDYGYDY